MHYLLTEEQQMIVDICRQIVDEKVKPVRAALDESKEFPWEAIKEIARSDLFRLFIEEGRVLLKVSGIHSFYVATLRKNGCFGESWIRYHLIRGGRKLRPPICAR